jgi:hypothetical protein
MPTTAEELMAAWELPPEAWERTTVKTTRFIRGTQQMELLSSCPLPEWSMDDLARTFGPGTFRIQAGPGPYRTKNTTLTISRNYADAAGFAAAPAYIPTPLEQQAAQTFKQATQGPVDPINLAAMIQTAVENALQRTQPKQETSALELVMKGFEMALTMTGRASEVAKTMAAPVEAAAKGWPDLISEVAPSLLATLQTAITAQRQPPLPAQAQPAQVQRPTLPPPALGAPPMPNPQTFPPAPPETVPILNIMRNYGPMLRGHLESPATPEELAGQLAGLLGPDLDPSIIATANYAREQGPEFLGNAAPYLATPKAAAVLIAWSDLIQTPEE